MRLVLVDTPVFSVERRDYAQPGREPLTRHVIVHPGAVVVLPLLADDQIVMVRQYRHAVEEELLELPAGTIDPDEPPIETARRELVEETGYQAGSMTPLVQFFTSPGILTERMHAYVARELVRVGQSLKHDERIVVDRITTGQARRALINGELRDAKTIATLGAYLLRTGGP